MNDETRVLRRMVIDLKLQVERLEHQLSVALEIMSDGMVEQFQEEFQQDIQIPDSDTNKKAEE